MFTDLSDNRRIYRRKDDQLLKRHIFLRIIDGLSKHIEMGGCMDKRPLFCIIFSAALFGISTPIAKLLVEDIPPLALAGLLYLGAFLGLFTYTIIRRMHSPGHDEREPPLEAGDLSWLAGAILAGGIIAPVALMYGLVFVSGFASSLLLNLEGVATAIIAVVVFKEHAGKRIWSALFLMTLAGASLSWDPSQGKLDLAGPLLIVLAMICWGIDNNLTQHISNKEPTQIVQLKGIIAGTASLSLAALLGLQVPLDASILYALVLGSLSYGLSLILFIKALEGLGSSRTGSFFSFGPFIGAVVSIPLLGETITWHLIAATILMLLGVWMMITEHHGHVHRHEHIVHTHMHELDMHHQHTHPNGQKGPHAHVHAHEPMTHSHVHWPDQHHRHEHK